MDEKHESTERLDINTLLATDEYQKSTMMLPCALGVTEKNEPVLFDLAKMPHVLIGGATGKGKSNTMHAILASLLQKKSPEELKLVLIDPKKVEFTGYESLSSNYLARLPYHEANESIVTNVEDAVNALHSLNELMTDRYALLREYECRNIEDYNEKLKNGELQPKPSSGSMPYYVVMIDEYSDFMMTAGADFERPLTCLAQLSRAVGIHIIIATQRVAFNVITGAIKANFPCRIAVKTMTEKDSKIIMDWPGAEQLSGNGDLLITCGDEPVYVRGAFVDFFNDIPALCIKLALQHPNYMPTLLPICERETERTETDLKGIGEFVFQYADPLFEEVVTTIVENQLASTSFIQRKFNIGYNRAGRLLDIAESVGIVSAPENDTYTREVLIADSNSLKHKLLDVKMKIYKQTESKLQGKGK